MLLQLWIATCCAANGSMEKKSAAATFVTVPTCLLLPLDFLALQSVVTTCCGAEGAGDGNSLVLQT
jgi:hypothetical protein